jgi:NAD dependent epimerase/dehydratase family enzyme
VLRTVLGELAEQLVGDMYVVPQRLTEHGFVFGAPTVTSMIAAALRKG